MNMRKIIIVCFLLLSISALLASCNNIEKSNLKYGEKISPTSSQTPISKIELTQNDKAKEKNVKPVGENIPISRAMVAKMLAFIGSDEKTIDGAKRTITFIDSTPKSWYDRYINNVFQSKLMSGSGNEFSPDKDLTLNQANILLKIINPSAKTQIQITSDNRDKSISYNLWTKLYYEALTNLAESKKQTVQQAFGITMDNFVVLATPVTNSQLKEFNIITSKGPYTCKGVYLDDYVDKQIDALTKNGEIISIIDIYDNAPTIKNAYVVKTTPANITVFMGGVERTYDYDTSNLNATTGTICDIKINGTTAESVVLYKDTISGVVKKIDSNMIEIDGKGQVLLGEDFEVYLVTNGVPKWKDLSELKVGSNVSEYVLSGGKIGGILIKDTSTPATMRISLSTTGFKSLIHKSVSLTSNENYTVTTGSNIKKFKAGEIFSVDFGFQSLFNNEKRMIVKSEDENGKIQINSITKGGGQNPKYRGTIEIGIENGGFSLVNEVSMDEYLYAVVPSEMPTSSGLEAAKVQAITARSYAYNEYFTNRYAKYGANVDDSVDCQVYNNTPENPTSIKAVDDTSGLCLTYEGGVVSANYFSTSAGITANSADVWVDGDGNFPISSPKYLTSTKQYTSGNFGDLSSEENAKKFFENTDIKAFDSDFGWFRWNVKMTTTQLSDSINSALKSRYLANPKLIKTLDKKDKTFKSVPIETIGVLNDISVVKRGTGGDLMEIELVGSRATVLVVTEYNIRALLIPSKVNSGEKDVILTEKDGSTLTNYKIMPSSFFTMEKSKDKKGNVTAITFYGGGNGHGVGMSQNGTKGMIDEGYTYNQVLTHFYPGSEVKKML